MNSSSPAESKRLLSVRDLQRIAGIGRTTIYEQIKSGRLRALKIGRRTVFLTEDVERWVQELPHA